MYSSFKRLATTSNCSTPTAPRMMSLLRSGKNTWVAPSSASCCRPWRSCLDFSGSFRRTRRNSSGAKCGMPVKPRTSPSLKVSPIWMVPWLCRPMMSPANASSSCSRSEEKKVSASPIRTSLPVRTWRIFMPFSYLPEQMRMKAMRSRCFGSMFAWILKMKPENFSSTGSTVRSLATRASGRGAQSTTASRTWSTPKLPSAVPKNTGVS
ncbi:hypothetical protein D9M71_541960 [compost metagenome]